MDVDFSKDGRRARVHARGYRGTSSETVFRIEDEHGRRLRTIRGARHGQEAVALFWRAVGATLPGATMSHDLERRIRSVRNARHDAMATPELPFGTEEAAATPGDAPSGSRRSRVMRASAAATAQTDLFEDTPVEHTEAAPVVVETGTVASTQSMRLPEPRLLDAAAIMLQRVDPGGLRPTDHADGYLYHVTNGPDAKLALEQGLWVSATDPVILTERRGVAYWLSILAEDYDYILDGPADFVVLRLRRPAVEDLLEADPHASRSAGCPCFLLTGAAEAHAHE